MHNDVLIKEEFTINIMVLMLPIHVAACVVLSVDKNKYDILLYFMCVVGLH